MSETLAVVMCVWQRIERLPKTLAMLRAQTDADWRLWLVVNQPELAELVQAVAYTDDRISVVVNQDNRGSFAKIEQGHKLALQGWRWVVLIDDDFDFGPTMLADLRAQARPDAIISWRVHTLIPGGNYWHRTPTQVGCEGSYVEGTGTIIPAGALADAGILDAIGRVHSPADNVWLSYYANGVLGYKLIQGRVPGCSEFQDGKNQYRQHIEMKIRFLDALRARGWRV